MTNISVRQAQESDIDKIAFFIDKLNLDGENLKAEQFIVAEIYGEFAGFGRVKPYNNLYEMSSIGVLKEYRKKGIGEKLIKRLIEIFPDNNIWITTKIPDYFRKFGFQETDNPPDEIRQKCQRVCFCTSGSIEDSCFMVLKK